MQFLAAYVLKGRTQAVLVTAVTAVLALLLPLFSYLSGATVALVTLRHGLQAGIQLAMLSTVAVALLMLGLQLPPQLSGVFLLVLWLPVWGLALSLRRTASPARSILLAMVFGVMVLLALMLAMDDATAWWQGLLQQIMEPLLQQASDSELQQIEANIVALAGQMNGVMAAGMVASLIGCLLLGRWWQALLFNPGGFGDEFRQLRLGRNLALAVALIAIVQMLWQESANVLLRDLLMVAQVGFALQGIALVHALVKLKGMHRGVLILMYVLLILMMGPVVLLLAMLGVMDNWIDFRSKFGQGTTTN